MRTRRLYDDHHYSAANRRLWHGKKLSRMPPKRSKQSMEVARLFFQSCQKHKVSVSRSSGFRRSSRHGRCAKTWFRCWEVLDFIPRSQRTDQQTRNDHAFATSRADGCLTLCIKASPFHLLFDQQTLASVPSENELNSSQSPVTRPPLVVALDSLLLAMRVESHTSRIQAILSVVMIE